MDNKKVILTYLQKNPLHYIGISETILRGMAELIYAGNDGMLILNEHSGTYYLSIENIHTFKLIDELIESNSLVMLHESRYTEELLRLGYVIEYPAAYGAAYLYRDITIPYIKGLTIKPLTWEYLPQVKSGYSLIKKENYLEQRIDAGMLGAFYYRQLAGFVGTHDEGSMGMLTIEPNFRHKGIGTALTAALVNKELRLGHNPVLPLFR